EVADRVAVLRGGRIEQVGSPQEVFDHPANPFIMDFLGNVNVFHGRVQNGRALVSGIELDYPDYPHDEERPFTAYIRPHELDIDPATEDDSGPKARVLHVNPAGPIARVRVRDEESDTVIHVDVGLH